MPKKAISEGLPGPKFGCVMTRERHNRSRLVWVFAAAVCLLPPAASAETASPVGRWLTKSGNAVVEIAQCGTNLCGRIVGLALDPGEKMPTDINGRPQCGLPIITDEASQGDGTWDGHILDPRTGHVWRAMLRVDSKGELVLRGYLGLPLLGSSETWRPYTGSIGPECHIEEQEAGSAGQEANHG